MERKTYISSEQKTLLTELLNKQENKILLSGKFSSSFTKKDLQSKWEQIAQILNAIPGSKKEWHQWRKTWQDLRSKVKAKQAKIVKNMAKTGGGPPPTEEITQAEESILATLDRATVEGIPSVVESYSHFILDDPMPDDEPLPSTSAGIQLSPLRPSVASDSSSSPPIVFAAEVESAPSTGTKTI